MGNVAASGGYYIACASNKIIAEPNTVTGSIGVFSMLFNTEKLFTDKAGITFDKVQTNPHADFGSGTREWDETEKKVMQHGVDHTYSLFMKRVSDVRKMDTAAVAELAQGRIYSGTDALALGLVDELGSLDLAIKRAKELAKIKEAKVVNYPEEKSAYDQFIESIFGKKDDELAKLQLLGKDYLWYKEVKKLQAFDKPQTRLPFTLVFK
jgi:protease-4